MMVYGIKSTKEINEIDTRNLENKLTSNDFAALSLLGIGFGFLVCAVLLFTRVVLGAF